MGARALPLDGTVSIVMANIYSIYDPKWQTSDSGVRLLVTPEVSSRQMITFWVSKECNGSEFKRKRNLITWTYVNNIR